MHPRTGRQRAYWACAGRLAKAVTAPAAMTISTDWRMACPMEVFPATLMYERVHAPFKAPDSGMIGPEMQVGGAVYWAPHSKWSNSSVRAGKKWPFGHVIVTCCPPGFSLSPLECAAISPHSGHFAPQYHSPTFV